MKQILSILFVCISFAAFGQTKIVRTVGVAHTDSIPTHTPSATGTFVSIDTTTNRLYFWNGNGWVFAGSGMQRISGSIPPAYTPGRGQFDLVINAIDSLYGWNGSAWSHLNPLRPTDGDKGDIDVTSSGAVWTIDTAAVTWLKLNQAAKDSINRVQTIDTFDRSGNAIRISISGDNQPAKLVQLDTLHIGFACSNETSNLTIGTAKVTYRAPIAMTIVGVRASVNTEPVGSTIIVDINENGASILGTKLTIDASEKTSVTAATAAVISDASIANDAELTFDIDQIGSSTAGKGLKVTIYYIKQ